MICLMNTTAAPAPMARLVNAHPYLLSSLLMIVAPLAILLAVSLITFGIMFPISYFMGWL